MLFYIQNNAPKDNSDRYKMMYLLKILYFSDRYHLRHYGITASDDHYKAMEKGPVPSIAYDLLKKSFYYLGLPDKDSINLINTGIKDLSEYQVNIEQQAQNKLSDSCKEAMDFGLNNFGKYNEIELSEISHLYPEWKSHEKHLDAKNRSIDMDLVEFFSDPENTENLKSYNIFEDPFKEDKEFLELMRNDFKRAI